MIDLDRIPTPCHIIDLDRLEANLSRIQQLKQVANCKILLAVKGFSAPYLFEYMGSTLDGISASGLYEARLGREQFGRYVQTYSPAFCRKDIDEIVRYSDSIIFNSARQLTQYGDEVRAAGRTCGIRINPLISDVHKTDADPCGPASRLGVPLPEVTDELLSQVDGIHIHAMCEQYADALERLVELVIEQLGPRIRATQGLRWINLGGGQLIGHEDYDIAHAAHALQRIKKEYGLEVILEPCEGILTQCGVFATQVCDIVTNQQDTAILDASPMCHMPDAVFRGWRHDVLGEVPTGEGYRYFLSGPTCFAGDTFGQYTFSKPLKIGDILYFQDTAAYTWVKNNLFNGIPFPSICTYSKAEGLKIRKTYDYNLFFRCL